MRILYLPLLLGFLACDNSDRITRQTSSDTTSGKTAEITKVLSNDLSQDDILDINIGGLNVSFDSLGEFDADRIETSGDTLFYYLDIGEYPTTLSVRYRPEQIVAVSERYRTTMSIQNEGPHCELDGWKCYESPWVISQPVFSKPYVRLTASQFSSEDDLRFPEYTKDELLAYVYEHCGPEWAEGLAIGDSIVEGKSSFYTSPGIRDHIFQFTIQHKNADTIVKYLVLKFPMGC